MFVPELYKYSVRTLQINEPATTVVEKVKYHAQLLSTYCFSVNFQYVVYHHRRSDLLHFLITQPLHPSALKPEHEEGYTHPLKSIRGFFIIVVSSGMMQGHLVVIFAGILLLQPLSLDYEPASPVIPLSSFGVSCAGQV